MALIDATRNADLSPRPSPQSFEKTYSRHDSHSFPELPCCGRTFPRNRRHLSRPIHRQETSLICQHQTFPRLVRPRPFQHHCLDPRQHPLHRNRQGYSGLSHHLHFISTTSCCIVESSILPTYCCCLVDPPLVASRPLSSTISPSSGMARCLL